MIWFASSLRVVAFERNKDVDRLKIAKITNEAKETAEKGGRFYSFSETLTGAEIRYIKSIGYSIKSLDGDGYEIGW